MQTYDFSVIWHLTARGYSSRIVAASCLPAGRVGGFTRQARQIVTHQSQWNLIITPQVDGCGYGRFGGCSMLGKWCGVMGGGGGGGGVVARLQQEGMWAVGCVRGGEGGGGGGGGGGGVGGSVGRV